MNKVFLMAQGKGSRWGNPDLPKQCIPIGGRPLIDRTMSMIPDGYLVTLISPDDVLSCISTERTFAYDYFVDPGSLLKGIWLCRHHIDPAMDNALFLLGDVVFSRKMAHYIFSKTWNEITLFGRIGANKKTGKAASELFALWIPYHSAESFFSELKLVWVSLADSGNEGKLWNLSREFGYRIRTLKDDYTDDIDSPQEYEQFYDLLNLSAIEDDLRLV